MGKRLDKMADYLGMTVEEMLERATFDSVSPGICIDCDFIVDEIEGDQREGYCENCGENRVKSALIIAGLV